LEKSHSLKTNGGQRWRVRSPHSHAHEVATSGNTQSVLVRRDAMDAYYQCEDCGHEFEKTDFLADVEDSPLACPACGGLDLGLVEQPESAEARNAV
jgi:putative FmdB family regulatory protein